MTAAHRVERDDAKVLQARREDKAEELRAAVLETVEDVLYRQFRVDHEEAEDMASAVEAALRTAGLLKKTRTKGTPEACEKCHRKLRPKNVSVKTRPGTFAHGGYGLCTACYLEEKAPSDRITRNPTPADCVACKRPMRRRGLTLKTHPGTILAGSRGFCKTCYERGDYKTADLTVCR
jgi:hypothetical protein